MDSTTVTHNGEGVKLTRLPPTEPPAADALRAIASAGAHFVLCGADKHPVSKAWESRPPDLPTVLTWAGRGGLVGVVPASLTAVVVDLDPEGADDTTPPLGAPVVQHATRRKGTHFWYRAPDGEVRNRKWARTAGGQHVGDVRGSRGFAILWNPGAVAAAVIGNDFTMADPVDPTTLPWPKKGKGTDVEQMRAAKNGERNDLLNRLAYKRAMAGENMATLRAAAIAAGLPVAEVSATISSAEAGANRQDRKPATAAAVAGAQRPPKGEGIDAGEAALSLAPSWKGGCMYVEGRGWFLRPSTDELWRPASTAELHGRLQSEAVWNTCRRGTRTGAIAAELTGQLHVDAARLDADDMVAGLPDGRVLNLRDGTTRAPLPDDLITMRLGATPDGSGAPAAWLRFLGEALSHADDLDGCVKYFRWWIRTALSGDCKEHRMVLLHGQSGTGKTTVSDLVLHIMGSYGATVSADHVVRQRNDHRQWIAQLVGKRFALISDLPTGGRWSTELQKLVGGELIEANLMRSNSIEFVSKVHVLATGNVSPRGESGIWRRLVQFECRHKPVPAQIDTALPAKLRAEAGRILHWALTGAADEPAMPAELRAAADAVRDEQDPFAAWIRESWRPDPLRRTTSAEMWQAYLLRWGATPERDRLTENAFGRLLTAEFGPAVKADIDGKRRVRVRKCAER